MSQYPEDATTTRALALLGLYEQVLPGLLSTLAARSQAARETAARQGVSPEAWAAMSIAERESVLARDRRNRRRRKAARQ